MHYFCCFAGFFFGRNLYLVALNNLKHFIYIVQSRITCSIYRFIVKLRLLHCAATKISVPQLLRTIKNMWIRVFFYSYILKKKETKRSHYKIFGSIAQILSLWLDLFFVSRILIIDLSKLKFLPNFVCNWTDLTIFRWSNWQKHPNLCKQK